MSQPGIPDDVMWGLPSVKDAIVLGAGSDIAQELIKRLRLRGCSVAEYHHDEPARGEAWDLLIVASGTLRPVGNFFNIDALDFEMCVFDNVFQPLRFLRQVWPYRRENAKVLFFAGPNPNISNAGFSAYAISKLMLIKMCEILAAENPGCTFFALGPGYVATKIHRGMEQPGRLSTSFEAIYAKLAWCIYDGHANGRNIHVHDSEIGVTGDRFRLRRIE